MSDTKLSYLKRILETSLTKKILRAVYRTVGAPLLAVGIDPKNARLLRYLPRYLLDRAAFIKAGGVITDTHVILEDYVQQAGAVSGHYFHQDLLVANFIREANPMRHIDVGSRIDGFVAHVASYREIEVIDIRPLVVTGHSQIKFIQRDLMSLDSSLVGICDSLSCLHALEHFGLGRYGDPIDPRGHIKGFYNLTKMLTQGGTLYISFPIGKSGIYFNAHRVFDSMDIFEWNKGLFELERFDYVDDLGNLHTNAVLPIHGLSYGCGIYTLKKTN
jgi:Caenorhabditis protein of unknown function, DUF268